MLSPTLLFPPSHCSVSANPTHPRRSRTLPPSQILNPKGKIRNIGKEGIYPYLQILIRRLLVLLIHRARAPLRTHPDGDEEHEADSDTESRVAGDFPALAWWR